MWPFDTLKQRPMRLEPSRKDDLRRWIYNFIAEKGLHDGLGLDERNLLAYLQHYRQPSVLDAYDKLLTGLLAKSGVRRGASCLDYGCWYGVSTVMMSLLGLKATGADINPKSIAAAHEMVQNWPVDVQFTDTNILDDVAERGQFDAIFIIDVLCSAHTNEIQRILTSSAALLAPGGSILISDYNNCRNNAFMESLRERWRSYEIGGGTAAEPAGAYYRMRLEFLRAALPDADDHELARLARGSCYLWGDELVAFARALRDGSVEPIFFDAASVRPPVQAHDGCTFGSALDVAAMADTLRRVGLETAVYPSLSDAPLKPTHEAEYSNTGFIIVGKRPR